LPCSQYATVALSILVLGTACERPASALSCVGHAARPYIRDKYTREVKTARVVAREYFKRFPKDRYDTAVESWRHLQCDNYEFTMKRLREPKGV
jgi:hypothetical protein